MHLGAHGPQAISFEKSAKLALRYKTELATCHKTFRFPAKRLNIGDLPHNSDVSRLLAALCFFTSCWNWNYDTGPKGPKLVGQQVEILKTKHLKLGC
jgi:hypothetical protein